MTFALLRTWQEVSEEILRQSHTTYNFCHTLSTLWNQQQKGFFFKPLWLWIRSSPTEHFPLDETSLSESPLRNTETRPALSVSIHDFPENYLMSPLLFLGTPYVTRDLHPEGPMDPVSFNGRRFSSWKNRKGCSRVFILSRLQTVSLQQLEASSVTFPLETEESVFLVLCYTLFGEFGVRIIFLAWYCLWLIAVTQVTVLRNLYASV